MNRKIIVLLLFVNSILATTNAFSQSKIGPSNDPSTTLKTFYLRYMKELSTIGPVSTVRIKSLQQKFCTEKLINNLKKIADEIDADPFLYTQDFDSTSIKTLAVEKSARGAHNYTVSYSDIPNDTKFTIYVALVKQDNFFKIDSIWYPNHVEAKADAKNRKGIKAIKDFYTSYILVKSNKTGHARLGVVESLFCTPKLINKTTNDLKTGITDSFLKSNHVNPSSIKSLTIASDPNNALLYTVSYVDSDGKKILLHVAVVNDSRGIKIDNVY